jgi:hypothetical protein
MINRTRIVAVALVVAAGPLNAQQPLGLGTAAAIGDAAVTESRRADAVLWNPALVGVYDGPLSSYSLLATDIAALPSGGWLTSASALGLEGDGLARVPRRLASATASSFGQVGVRWLATQHREYAVSLSSGEIAGADVPQEIGAALGGSRAGGPLPADSAMRGTYTVLAGTRGAHLGRMPVLGTVWIGATLKGWLVHSYARGGFSADAPAEDAYREAVIQNVPGYGVDVGVLLQPAERIRIGISASNVAAGAFRPKRGPRVRDVGVVAGDGGYDVVEAIGAHLGAGDEDTEEGRLAAGLWESLAFPAVLRAGGSLETGFGSLSAAWRTSVREGGLDPEWLATPFTLAFAGNSALPVRASYAWGGGTGRIGLGVQMGSCERRWVAGIVRQTGPWGTSYGASASLSIGSAAGCDAFRTR